jgi:hypothetical protein
MINPPKMKEKKRSFEYLGRMALILVAVSGFTSACHKADPQQLADMATQELGLPVFLWAFSNDECASRQLQTVFNEYDSWNSAGKSALAKRFNTTYKAIIVLESRDLGETQGELKEVQLWNNHRYVIESRTISDTRMNASGFKPGVEVDKGNEGDVEGRVLTIQATYSADKSVRKTYFTYDPKLFASLSSEAALEEAVRDGNVELNGTAVAAPDNCGALARIENFF